MNKINKIILCKILINRKQLREWVKKNIHIYKNKEKQVKILALILLYKIDKKNLHCTTNNSIKIKSIN